MEQKQVFYSIIRGIRITLKQPCGVMGSKHTMIQLEFGAFVKDKAIRRGFCLIVCPHGSCEPYPYFLQGVTGTGERREPRVVPLFLGGGPKEDGPGSQ